MMFGVAQAARLVRIALLVLVGVAFSAACETASAMRLPAPEEGDN